MKKIILLCSNGMSTSMMVAKMKEAAKKIGYDCTIAAYALSAASEVTADADCILIGPQVKHKLGEVQAACPGIPAAPIDMKDYGMMNGVAVLKAARKILTPVLRPLIGIPGSAALALIASMQSTDGGAALTRQLKDAGELTESETNTFAAFQMTADAPITNFFSSGAVLFTLVAADGTLAVPVSLGLCLGVILLGKVLSANMMRLLQIRASRK